MGRRETLGILLVNTGSPSAPETAETRAYLRQFLSDPRVLDIHPVARWLLVNLIILPSRPRRSAHAYKSIWTKRGSPLIANSRDFRDALARRFQDAQVEIGMAYGEPSVHQAIDVLLSKGASRLVIVPMFPQYASATVGSVLEAAYRSLAKKQNVPPVTVAAPFYGDPGFLDAWAEVARPELTSFRPDHVLISYHGLPLRQIRKSDPTGTHCLTSEGCCDRYLEANPNCYRAHCLATTRSIVERLKLAPASYTVVFQSKLGRDPWLLPATDEEIVRKAQEGVRRLAIVSPAFVADCLETLEELGMRGREDFLKHGGTDFLLVKSLNAHPAWVDAMERLIRNSVGEGARD